jgi:hypothetical protein
MHNALYLLSSLVTKSSAVSGTLENDFIAFLEASNGEYMAAAEEQSCRRVICFLESETVLCWNQ